MRRIFGWALAVAAAFLATSAAFAGPTLNRADLRAGQDLSGTWNYSVDPYRDGVSGFHRGPPGVGHRRYDDSDVDQVTRADPKALYEYDMRRSPTATLPASWLTHAPEMRHYQGLVWYQRRFDSAALKPGQRAFLRFEAANYTAKVFLNGQAVGEHEGGFTPFSFEVTSLLRAGENQVTVGVDSTPSADGAPPPVTDWENYGGVTRPVRLVITPATFVDEAWVRLTRDGRTIAADVKLDGPAAAGQAVSVRVAGLTLSGQAGADGVAKLSAPAPKSLKRWAPGAPTLYDVRVEAGDDVLTDRVGFRTIEVRGGEILLNGKPVFLRGICLHEEELGENPARTITEANARALLGEARDGLHANFVRLAHYPHSEVTTRVADEMGLLVWSEIPIYWLVAFDNPRTLKLARDMLADSIRRDRNRASIVLWSVANETPVSDARNAFLGTLTDDVRTLDDTRLVTAALLAARKTVDAPDGRHAEQWIDDPLAAKLDVLAVNTYAGWYGDDPLDAVSRITWRATDKPMVFSEFGADALAGFSDPVLMRKFSEDFQARYYVQTLAMAANAPSLRGMSPWILKDFRSPRRQHPVYQQGWNRKGLISPTGRRKAAFKVLADYYAKLAGDGR
ncbi:beta-glucuronidase [Caulobacter sp. D4A]|uniref:glycoside hydrolase family 2 protein n=1 Tax=unclassified Caulobacter TaxID=2648921 RepID=UPI000D72B3A1|nr:MULTISPECIES: glycoside hydrolase family 2 TIM barrel-domain containing protein [unclassified Caulobacter]PXA89462.1 beta-glucuronidase [Caulobacter sp. D4A]PXA92757.1 beta-glucuronidase [Caulobacter sp. D5]